MALNNAYELMGMRHHLEQSWIWHFASSRSRPGAGAFGEMVKREGLTSALNWMNGPANRAGMVYGRDAASLARRLDGSPAAEVVLYREGDEAIARRDGEELRFRPTAGGWETSGDETLLDQPDALERAWCALANPNAGELIVSPPAGVELTDLAGRSHLGGGSHGSLELGDSEVPMLTVGLGDRVPPRIVDVAPLAIEHFGVELPYGRPAHAAA